ncbi:hypothetical protein, partial [Ruegeria jejuensis]|uniref:hypothetical protein n=1 Tax=Ruegeria jejuensis TaxID=3233338 RepID=UPI00355BFAB9
GGSILIAHANRRLCFRYVQSDKTLFHFALLSLFQCHHALAKRAVARLLEFHPSARNSLRDAFYTALLQQ